MPEAVLEVVPEVVPEVAERVAAMLEDLRLEGWVALLRRFHHRTHTQQ